MKDRRFWLAVVSACMATQHNTGEAAVAAVPDAGREYSVRVHTLAAEEEAVVSLFDDYRYEEVIETANAAWPRLEAMPDRVLYCVAECYIRTGQVRLAKTSFELLIAHSPQNHRYRAGLAYTLLYAGQLDRGIAMYRQVLQENQGMLAGAAEDAAALLSMGNIGGGKALFQIVINSSPDKQHYSQLYEKSLRMYRLADDVPAVQAPTAAGVAQTAVSAENERKLLHTQAVEMAQNGQYQQSLDIMARLVKADAQDKSLLFDYVTILQQAGQNEQAIDVYNQQSGTSMPFSVIRSVSTAYFQLQDYDKALAVLQPAIIRGERDALLWAGEMNLRSGNTIAAQAYYERLLSLNPNDYEVYLSRGMLSLQIKDYKQAVRDLERARRLLPECPDKADWLTKLEHNLAIAYMNSGQDQKAASILVNYTKTLPVEGSLASDYIIALGNSSQYELAVREGERLWPTYTDVPIPGLRSLAESYLRLGKQGEALAVYRYLAGLQPSNNASRQMLAFQLMLNGRTAEGLSYYGQLLGTAPASVDAVIADAATLINTDKYIDGKSLFELVLSKYPNPAYRRQYAEVLVKKNHNRAAYKQYQLLAAQPEGELDGLSGMAHTASALGDYSKSRQALDTITSKYGRSKAVTALEPKTISADRQNYQGPAPQVIGAATSQASPAYAIAEWKNPTGSGNSGATAVKCNTEISQDEFAYEMAQLAANFLSAPVTSTENFKIEFAFAISTITAKAMPLIPSEQRNDFTYEMAQITSNVINDQNLDVKKAKMQFAQLTTEVVNRIDRAIADKKITTLRRNDNIESQTLASSNKTGGDSPKASASGDVDPATYNRLMDDLLQIGDSSKHKNNKINVDGEIRFHYAANSGSTQWDKDASGLRLYLGAETRINKDWQLFSMLEGQKSIKNYNNKLELSRLYLEGKVGASTVKAGKFGYLMAEGNIYDSGFTGIKVDFGDPIKYSLSYGETEDTKTTYIATARYKDFDYNLETGVYHYRLDDGSNKTNTIWNIGGNYNFSNFSIGAMYLGSSLKDSKGNSDGYVLSLNYGDLRTYRPGTYSMFAKYYNQPQGTYIDHGMNGRGNSMQGLKGYGVGVSYALAKDLVAGVEYYDLADKVTGEKGKTIWTQLTHYF
ncbi:outer membrane protein PgaA [Sporomusa ovata DSM 2662]|uniref:TPR domain protein, putative component of TonB system n=1 Tax=Sporomusa ovata TaxID=2378 RepID=A0A0U1L5C6_9FIRM|nr:tetratricopeptide repeat protein [Sporomusa ovata]EQB28561.1 TPR repeat containing protein [Sporomusa ovata DSM 2662]CQR74891.1 TPR domain protein, putative component of TonB system [Sporomusa ovata]